MDAALTMPSFAWYGKMPGAGDFVSRRFPWRSQQAWDQWLANGVEELRAQSLESGPAIWRNMPAWGFLVPRLVSADAAQLGLLLPSQDRVGRLFPVLIMIPILDVAVRTALITHAVTISTAWAQLVKLAQQERWPVERFDTELSASLGTSLATELPELDPEVTLPPQISASILPWPDLASSFDPEGRESYWWSVPPAATGFRARSFSGTLTTAHFCALAS